MSRDVAERAIAEQGGTVKSSVSCRVNYLVQAAAFDPCARGGVSAKARKAAELAAHLKAPYCPMHHDLYAFNGCPVEAVEAAAAQAGATLLQPKLNVPMAI